jgi:hypothetical protein
MSGKVLFIHEYSIYLMKYSKLDELLLYIKRYLNMIVLFLNNMYAVASLAQFEFSSLSG